MAGNDDMWATAETANDKMWEPVSTSNDKMWCVGLGDAIVRYARLILSCAEKIYHGETKPTTFMMQVKDKIYRMITRNSRQY